MKKLLIGLLFLSTIYAEEPKDTPGIDKLTSEESQTVADNMLEIQNLQLQLQGLQLRIDQVQAKYSKLQSELAVKYDKVGCTLSLKRVWICPEKDKE